MIQISRINSRCPILSKFQYKIYLYLSVLGHPYEGHGGYGYGVPPGRIQNPQKNHPQIPGGYHGAPRIPVDSPNSEVYDGPSDVKVRNGAPINGGHYGPSRIGSPNRGTDMSRRHGGFGEVYGGMDTRGE